MLLFLVTGTETSGESQPSSTPEEQPDRRSMSVMATMGSSTEEQIDTSDVTENDEQHPRSNVPGIDFEVLHVFSIS